MRQWIEGLIVSSVALLIPIKAVIITVGIVVFADLFTGILAAIKRKEKITSAGLSRTVAKMAVYQTVIITGYLIQVNLIANMLPLVNIVGSVIGLVEFKSLIENANFILGDDLFREVIKKLASKNDTEENKKQDPPKSSS